MVSSLLSSFHSSCSRLPLPLKAEAGSDFIRTLFHWGLRLIWVHCIDLIRFVSIFLFFPLFVPAFRRATSNVDIIHLYSRGFHPGLILSAPLLAHWIKLN